MVFRSKMNGVFKGLIVFCIVMMLVLCGLPLLFDDTATMLDVWILSGMIFFTIAFILWIIVDLKYVLKEDVLYIRSGPFIKRVRYDQITAVEKASQIVVGLRFVSSSDAVEVKYEPSMFGGVIISPYEQQKFIEELTKRSPHL